MCYISSEQNMSSTAVNSLAPPPPPPPPESESVQTPATTPAVANIPGQGVQEYSNYTDENYYNSEEYYRYYYANYYNTQPQQPGYDYNAQVANYNYYQNYDQGQAQQHASYYAQQAHAYSGTSQDNAAKDHQQFSNNNKSLQITPTTSKSKEKLVHDKIKSPNSDSTANKTDLAPPPPPSSTVTTSALETPPKISIPSVVSTNGYPSNLASPAILSPSTAQATPPSLFSVPPPGYYHYNQHLQYPPQQMVQQQQQQQQQQQTYMNAYQQPNSSPYSNTTPVKHTFNQNFKTQSNNKPKPNFWQNKSSAFSKETHSGECKSNQTPIVATKNTDGEVKFELNKKKTPPSINPASMDCTSDNSSHYSRASRWQPKIYSDTQQTSISDLTLKDGNICDGLKRFMKRCFMQHPNSSEVEKILHDRLLCTVREGNQLNIDWDTEVVPDIINIIRNEPLSKIRKLSNTPFSSTVESKLTPNKDAKKHNFSKNYNGFGRFDETATPVAKSSSNTSVNSHNDNHNDYGRSKKDNRDRYDYNQHKGSDEKSPRRYKPYDSPDRRDSKDYRSSRDRKYSDDRSYKNNRNRTSSWNSVYRFAIMCVLCVCVYMCMRACVYIYACEYINAYACLSVCDFLCFFICVYIHVKTT